MVLKPVAKLLRTDILHPSDDEFGQVLSGSIRIEAPFRIVRSFAKDSIRLPLTTGKISAFPPDPSDYQIRPTLDDNLLA